MVGSDSEAQEVMIIKIAHDSEMIAPKYHLPPVSDVRWDFKFWHATK